MAECFLRENGYRILARNYRCPLGEIDLVAMDGESLVFIEVKTRRGETFGHPAESVDAIKRRRLYRVARHFIAQTRTGALPCRFDVVSVRPGGCDPAVEVIRGAF